MKITVIWKGSLTVEQKAVCLAGIDSPGVPNCTVARGGVRSPVVISPAHHVNEKDMKIVDSIVRGDKIISVKIEGEKAPKELAPKPTPKPETEE